MDGMDQVDGRGQVVRIYAEILGALRLCLPARYHGRGSMCPISFDRTLATEDFAGDEQEPL